MFVVSGVYDDGVIILTPDTVFIRSPISRCHSEDCKSEESVLMHRQTTRMGDRILRIFDAQNDSVCWVNIRCL